MNQGFVCATSDVPLAPTMHKVLLMLSMLHVRLASGKVLNNMAKLGALQADVEHSGQFEGFVGHSGLTAVQEFPIRQHCTPFQPRLHVLSITVCKDTSY